MSEVARTLQAQLTVDGKPCALLTIENDLTGTEECPNYRVQLDTFREHLSLTTTIKGFTREGKTRLDLFAEAFRLISEVERT